MSTGKREEYYRRYHQEHKEERNAAGRKRYQEHKEEKKATNKKRYREHKEQIRVLGKTPERVAFDRKIRKENKARAIQMFGDRCHDCDEWFPSGLYVFHHLEPLSKSDHISNMINRKWSQKMEAELAKCIMICPTCHLARHGGYFGKPIKGE